MTKTHLLIAMLVQLVIGLINGLSVSVLSIELNWPLWKTTLILCAVTACFIIIEYSPGIHAY